MQNLAIKTRQRFKNVLGATEFTIHHAYRLCKLFEIFELVKPVQSLCSVVGHLRLKVACMRESNVTPNISRNR